MLRFVAILQFILLLLLIFSCNADEAKCTIKPYEAKGDKSPGSNGYVIEVSYTRKKLKLWIKLIKINGTTTKSMDISKGFVPGEIYKGKNTKML